MAIFNFVYPEALQFFEIQQDLMPRDEASRAGLKILPNKDAPTFKIRWSQDDNNYGLMAFRGLNGRPTKVNRLGTNVFEQEPGVYGEFQEIEEQELTERAAISDITKPIPIDELIFKANNQIIQHQSERKEFSVWQLLLNGTYSVPGPGPNGVMIYTDTYPVQTYSPVIPWSATTTATPIANLQSMQQKWIGHSVDFGAKAKFYINQQEANFLLNNSNPNDFGGRRMMWGNTINNIEAANSYFASQNLPQILIYDLGFQNQAVSGVETSLSQYTQFIPTGKGVLVGVRSDGSPVGHFMNTINLANPGRGSGPYSFVKDSASGLNAPKEVPGKIQVHRGFNGGPILEFPSAIVSVTGI